MSSKKFEPDIITVVHKRSTKVIQYKEGAEAGRRPEKGFVEHGPAGLKPIGG